MAELANSQKFKTVTTNMGRNAVALAHATGTSVKVTHIAVGDGSGNPIEPNASMTELVHEVFRGTVNDVVILEDRPGQFTAELIIPQNTGGFFIREVGLFLEDGTLFAVGSTPLTEKPDLSSGAASDLIIRMIIRILDAGLIEILVDPAQVLVTRDLLERRLKEHDQNEDAHAQAFGLHNGDEEAHSILLSPIKQSISNSQGSIADLEAIIRDAQERGQIQNCSNINTNIVNIDTLFQSGSYVLTYNQGKPENFPFENSYAFLYVFGYAYNEMEKDTYCTVQIAYSRNAVNPQEMAIRYYERDTKRWYPWTALAFDRHVFYKLLQSRKAIGIVTLSNVIVGKPIIITCSGGGTAEIFGSNTITGALEINARFIIGSDSDGTNKNSFNAVIIPNKKTVTVNITKISGEPEIRFYQ